MMKRIRWTWAVLRQRKIRSAWVAWRCSGLIQKFHRQQEAKRALPQLPGVPLDMSISPEAQALLKVWCPEDKTPHR
jgi:hypothetical protein